MPKNPRLIDLSGQRFGRWVVVDQSGNAPGGGALWNCICDCGTERAVIGADLRKGKSVSCGCLIDTARLGNLKRTHSASGTRLHRTWKNMRARCKNPNNPRFKYYGGRGISICPEWEHFETFRDWAMSSGYQEHLSIERIDVDGNYTPDNCTWAGADIQAANRRFVQKAPDGELWWHKAKRNGITHTAFRQRALAGWPMEQAVSWPMHERRVERDRDSLGRYASHSCSSGCFISLSANNSA